MTPSSRFDRDRASDEFGVVWLRIFVQSFLNVTKYLLMVGLCYESNLFIYYIIYFNRAIKRDRPELGDSSSLGG